MYDAREAQQVVAEFHGKLIDVVLKNIEDAARAGKSTCNYTLPGVRRQPNMLDSQSALDEESAVIGELNRRGFSCYLCQEGGDPCGAFFLRISWY